MQLSDSAGRRGKSRFTPANQRALPSTHQQAGRRLVALAQAPPTLTSAAVRAGKAAARRRGRASWDRGGREVGTVLGTLGGGEWLLLRPLTAPSTRVCGLARRCAPGPRSRHRARPRGRAAPAVGGPRSPSGGPCIRLHKLWEGPRADT